MRAVTRRYLIGFAAWLPFFLLWTGVGLSSGMASVREALAGAFVSMGSAGVLAVPVWLACERWPWPSGFRLGFYALQLLLAFFYALAWTLALKASSALNPRSSTSSTRGSRIVPTLRAIRLSRLSASASSGDGLPTIERKGG